MSYDRTGKKEKGEEEQERWRDMVMMQRMMLMTSSGDGQQTLLKGSAGREVNTNMRD